MSVLAYVAALLAGAGIACQTGSNIELKPGTRSSLLVNQRCR